MSLLKVPKKQAARIKVKISIKKILINVTSRNLSTGQEALA